MAMHVNNLDAAALSMTRARPSATGPAKTGVAASGGFTERHAAAFAVLGVESLLFTKSMPAGIASAGAGGTTLDAIASEYNRAVISTKTAQPGISDANARHIARYKTIMANRASFPPGKFSIHTELANGSSITTQVPATGGSLAPAKLEVSASVSGAVVQTAGTQASVTDGQLDAAYKEWL